MVKLCQDCQIRPIYAPRSKVCLSCHRHRRRKIVREWELRNPEKVDKNKRKWIAKNPEKFKEIIKKSRKKNHKKIRCRYIDKKCIIKEFCVACGTTNDLQLHHFTYDIPSDWIVLCKTCHRDWHNQYGNSKI